MLATSNGVTKEQKTHQVLNQPPALENYNLFSSDKVLVEAVLREGAGWAMDELADLGALLGKPETIALGFKANEYTPVLKTHDRFGHRVDEIEFHPAWHELMRIAFRYGIHNLPWREPKKGAHVARTALMMLASQNEAGHGCPISMTFSCVPSLRKQPEVAEEWLPRLMSREYDPAYRSAAEKKGILIGMAMTEKQGGSDVRANTTTAVARGRGGPGQAYSLTGHKWFCSAPMSDAFLVLAQAPGGLSCFLLPRWTPEKKRNRFYIQRLKSKLGNKSNASGEVEFDDAYAVLIGEEGRGVPTIIEMVSHTRLDCTTSSAALMRQALVQSLHHATHRAAFGKRLGEHPLMQNVLADLAIESEAATLLTMRLARAYDEAQDSRQEELFKRIATAIAKYWICKRAPSHTYECLECLGGNGYVEESILPRIYRESPVNSVWEGSGNVICLDVLRAMKHEPETVDALFAEISEAKGANPRFDVYVDRLKAQCGDSATAQEQARRLVEQMALALEGSLILRYAPSVVADAFCASRLDGDWGRTFGTLSAGADCRSIIERASVPELDAR